MNIAVVGASGMLGHVTTLYLRQQGHKVDTIAKSRPLDTGTVLLDITSPAAVLTFPWEQYDAVINCAAVLVKASESNKPAAVLANAWFPHQLEQILSGASTRIIQVSSDGVFSGKNAPYLETDSSDCPAFYGKTKFLGELHNGKDLTIRASFVGPEYFPEGRSLFHWFVTQKGSGPGYSETYFNGITSLAFAQFIHRILPHPPTGVLHVGAKETISKARFLTLIKDVFHLDGVQVQAHPTEKTDHTLHTLQSPPLFPAQSYVQMLEELSAWMKQNRAYYTHYSFL